MHRGYLSSLGAVQNDKLARARDHDISAVAYQVFGFAGHGSQSLVTRM